MGWFRQRGDASPTLVSVLGDDSLSAAGAGALLSPRYVLTCAHVVNTALGREEMEVRPPPRSARLHVVLHQGAETHESAARQVRWVPPRRSDRSHREEGDLAVLELDEPAASIRAVAWEDMTEGRKVRAWHGGGDLITFANTTIQVPDTWHYYADAELKGAAIQRGYSGGPLFAEGDLTVAVGLVTHHIINERLLSDSQVIRRTLAVPWQRIREELGADAYDMIEPLPAPFSDTGKVPDGAVDFLLQLFDGRGQLEYQANRLANALGLRLATDESETALPLQEELAALLFTEARALATWAELLAGTLGKEGRKTLDRLVDLGRPEGVRLLSVREHQRLMALLAPVNAAHPRLLCQAARHILQLTNRVPSWVNAGVLPEARLEAAVDDLDWDSVDMVPPLLRLGVFLAAAADDKAIRKKLDAWCDDVGRRLDRDRSLLADCRAQAASWVKLRRRPVTRIVVDLSRNEAAAERYFCHIWRVREGRPPEPAGISAGPYTAAEIGREVHGLAEKQENGGDGPSPWIDVVIGPQNLDLPVESWTAAGVLEGLDEVGIPIAAEEDSPLVLGAEYPVTLRLPAEETEAGRDRRGMLERRWAAGRQGPVVVKEDIDLRSARRALIGEHRDAAWAVLHGEQKRRAMLLALCLANGVPVLVWDREATHVEHAQRLDDIVGSVALSDLPEAVRGFRERVYYQAGTVAARPAIVWDDPSVAIPAPPDYGDPSDAVTTPGRTAAR